MLTYTLSRICSLIDARKAQVNWWIHRGVCRPSIAESAGQGQANLFYFIDLLMFAIAKELATFGVEVTVLRAITEQLQSLDDDARISDGNAGVRADWRRFRDPALRPENWTAIFLLALSPQLDEGFGALLLVGEKSSGKLDLNKWRPSPGPSWLTIDVGRLLKTLEVKTGDHWQRIVDAPSQVASQITREPRGRAAKTKRRGRK